MGQGIIEAGLFRTERVELETRTTDPPSPADGERWLRTDLDGETDKLAELRWYDGSTTNNINIVATGSTDSGFEEVLRVQTPNGVGVIPAISPPGDAGHPSQRLRHAGGDYGLGVTGIPDSEDLQAHYDASNLTSVDPWGAEVGPDLSTTGEPTVISGEKNGKNVVRYDGTDDGHSGSFASAVSQPVQIFGVFALRSQDGTNANYFFASTGNSNKRAALGENSAKDLFIHAGGSNVDDGASDLNWHVANIYLDGSNSTLRLDGSQVASGGAGSGNYEGVSLGWLEWNSGNYTNVDIGEYFSYPQDKRSVESDAERYLADKWDITI